MNCHQCPHDGRPTRRCITCRQGGHTRPLAAVSLDALDYAVQPAIFVETNRSETEEEWSMGSEAVRDFFETFWQLTDGQRRLLAAIMTAPAHSTQADFARQLKWSPQRVSGTLKQLARASEMLAGVVATKVRKRGRG